MALIPEPDPDTVQKVKRYMVENNIADFSVDELDRVFSFVLQSDNCLRIVEYLVNEEGMTIDSLYAEMS